MCSCKAPPEGHLHRRQHERRGLAFKFGPACARRTTNDSAFKKEAAETGEKKEENAREDAEDDDR